MVDMSHSRLPLNDEQTADLAHVDGETYEKSRVAGSPPRTLANNDFDAGDERRCFLVSFVVSAKGGRLQGCRHSGVQFIMPPGSAGFPTRITCRFLTDECLTGVAVKPPISDGEALASRVLELRPVNYKFLCPILIHIPHFAALHNGEREIVVYRSNNGDKWIEHTPKPDHSAIREIYQKVGLDDECVSQLERNKDKIASILTIDVPRYFAVCSRVSQDSVIVDHKGATINSTFVPGAVMHIPEKALQKPVKISLQTIVVSPDLVLRMVRAGQLKLGPDDSASNAVVPSFSPVVSVEPRRRKFHKPITLTIPLPLSVLTNSRQSPGSSVSLRDRAETNDSALNGATEAVSDGNQVYACDLQSLRLLCSISGGSHPVRWEDITSHTPLTFQKSAVTFTSTVSARFWLVDVEDSAQCTRIAHAVYKEVTLVPFIATFLVSAKRTDPTRAELRVNCLTDTKEFQPLGKQEQFVKAAQSKEVEVLNGRPIFVVLEEDYKSAKKSKRWVLPFRAFHDNHLDIVVYTGEPEEEWSLCLSFYQPKALPINKTCGMEDSHPKTVPLCSVLVTLPAFSDQPNLPNEYADHARSVDGSRDAVKYVSTAAYESSLTQFDETSTKELSILQEIASALCGDWPALAFELGFSAGQIADITRLHPEKPALHMLRTWLTSYSSSGGTNLTLGRVGFLEEVLRRIGRDDITTDYLSSPSRPQGDYSGHQPAEAVRTSGCSDPLSSAENSRVDDCSQEPKDLAGEAIQSLADQLLQSFSPRHLVDSLLAAQQR